MNFLKIAWRDVSNILKNRFIRVSVIAIVIVPLLYSLLYLYAFWDPYSKLSEMPVAVVNLDKGGVRDNSQVNYGNQVIDNLKENKNIGWRFVNYDEAQKGLNSKEYYALIVIPEDFTKDTLTAEQKDMIQPKIYFTTNDKANFLASQINGKVALELKAEITANMTQEVDKTLFDNFYDVKDKIQQAADGSKQISDGNSTLASKIPDMLSGVKQLNDGSSQLNDGLKSAQIGTAALYNGASQLNSGLGTINGKMPQLNDGIGKLSNGASTIADAVTQAKAMYNDALDKLNANKDLFALVNVDNANNMRKILEDASALGSADTSILNVVNKDNVALLNKTFSDAENVKNMFGIDKNSSSAIQSLIANLLNPNNAAANFSNITNLINDANISNQAMSGVDPTQIPALQKSIGNIMNNSDKLSNLIGAAKNMPDLSGLNPLMANIPSLMDNSEQLSGILDGASKLNSMLTQIQDPSEQSSLQALSAGNTPTNLAYIEGAINASPVPNKAQLVQLVDSYSALVNVKTIDLFSNGTKTTMGAIITLGTPDNVATLNSIMDAAFPTNDPVKAPLNALAKGYEDYANNTITLLNQTNLLNSGITQNATIIANTKGMLDGITNYKTYYPTQYAQIKGLIGEVPQLEAQINDLKNAGVMDDTGNLLTFVAANKANLIPLVTKLGDIKTDLDNNSQTLGLITTLMQNASKDPQAIQKIQSLQVDLINAQQVIAALNTPDMINKLNSAPELVNQLTSMQKELNDNKDILQVAQNALSDGNVQEANGLLNAIPDLTNKVNALADGSQALANGLKTLKEDSIPTLAGGISQLYTGSSQLMNGIAKPEEVNGITLPSNVSNATLMAGITQLYGGSTQLNNGLSTLNGKMPDLLDGANKLKDGSKELSDKLADGSTQFNGKLLNDSTTMSQFLSKPVDVEQNSINSVKNYGTGFAPYFISLSLWVGVIMMFFVITEDVDDDIEANTLSLVLGKFLSYGLIGIIQAVLASAIVLALGLHPANILLYFLFNVFMSFVFIAIIQSLVFLLGQAGRLLSIVLLILQLTSCAGTFPLEVVPTFFKVLNPIMPFTYTVEALRELISGVDYSIVAKDAGILAAYMIAFVIISVLMKDHADRVKKSIKAKKEAATV